MLLCTANVLLLLQVGHMLQLLGQPRDVLELSYCLGLPSEESTLGSNACSELPAAQPSEAGGTALGAAAEAAATPQRLAAPPLAPAQGAVLPFEAAAGPAATPQQLAASLLAPAAPPPSLTTRRLSHMPEALPDLTPDEGSLPQAAHTAAPEAHAQECSATRSGGGPPGAAGSHQQSRPGAGQPQGSGGQQQQGQRVLLAPETLHMSPLMKQQSELLDALPDMELGMDLDAAAGGPAAAAAPHGAAAAAGASSDALAEHGTARARQGWQVPANRGGAVAMQLRFGHAGGSGDDPAAQHTRGAVGPAEGSQPAAFQGTGGGAGGEGSAGGGFCFARSPLQPRVATQVTSPARDLVPSDRRRAKRKRSAQRLLGSGPGQGVLGSEVEQVGGVLHSRWPCMRAAACNLQSQLRQLFVMGCHWQHSLEQVGGCM